jgi:hypothetical protein
MATMFRQKERSRSLTGDANDHLWSETSMLFFVHTNALAPYT